MINRKSTLINIFTELGVLEGHQFKSRAYTKAAKILQIICDSDFESRTSFTDLEGIGTSINNKILEYKATGKVKKLDELRNESKDFLDPKLYKIRKGFVTKRIPYEEAKKLKDIISYFLGQELYGKVMYLGSLRRKKEYIADLDLVAIGDAYVETVEKLKQIPDIKIEVQGDKKTTFIYPNVEKTSIDVTRCEEHEKVFAMLHFTGSKENNVAMRARAKKMGYQLNQYGLTPLQPTINTTTVFETEQDVYAFLKMRYLKPENR